MRAEPHAPRPSRPFLNLFCLTKIVCSSSFCGACEKIIYLTASLLRNEVAPRWVREIWGLPRRRFSHTTTDALLTTLCIKLDTARTFSVTRPRAWGVSEHDVFLRSDVLFIKVCNDRVGFELRSFFSGGCPFERRRWWTRENQAFRVGMRGGSTPGSVSLSN